MVAPTPAPGEPTIGALIRRAIDGRRTSERTRTQRHRYWDKWGCGLEALTVSEATAEAIRTWALSLPTGGDRGWRAASQPFSMACWIVDIPADLGPRPPARSSHREVYSRAEVGALIEAARAERSGLIIELLFATGLRPGEARALEPHHVRGGLVRVRQAVVEVEGRQCVGPPKTPGSVRDVRVGPRLAACLEAWADRRETKTRRFMFGRDQTAYRPKSLADLWARVHERAGVPVRGGPHHARHWHGSSLLREGVCLPEVSRRLSHANPRLTARSTLTSSRRPSPRPSHALSTAGEAV